MSTLYLHIGSPKTGTTAIQHLLAKNRPLLESKGICFPDLGFRYTNVGNKRNAHFLVVPPEEYPEDYEKGLNMVADLGTRFGTLILSDESIWNAAQRIPNFFARLRQELEKRGLSLRVIAYLRRQDLIVQSMYVQRVKQDNDAHFSFDSYLRRIQKRRFPVPLDYDAYLSRIADVVGWDAMHIRIYEQGQFQGEEKTLFSDFLDLFGLKMADGFQMSKEEYNLRPDALQIEFKRILNKLPPKDFEENPMLPTMEQMCRLVAPKNGRGEHTYFAPGKQAEFLKKYEAGNARLARTYFHRPDGRLFYEVPKELPTAVVSDRELLELLLLTCAHLYKQLENQDRRQQKAIKESDVVYRFKRKFHLLPKK